MPDGTIQRAICQPGPQTGEAVKNHKGWQQTRLVGEPSGETPVRKMKPRVTSPEKPRKDGPDHFAAWGRFATVSAIPDHFTLSVEGLERRGRLVREYHRRDLGLVVEHVWRETLCDVVELEDRRRARDELTTQLIDLVVETFKHRFGRRYRFASLSKWMRSTLVAAVVDLLDYDLEAALKHEAFTEEKAEPIVIRILARHGLKLVGPDGRLLARIPRNAREVFYVPFARSLLQQHVRDTDDRPLSEEAIEEILVWLSILEKAEATAEQGPDDQARDPDDVSAPLETAWKVVVVRRFGSEAAYRQQAEILSTRIFGVYRVPFPIQLFGTARHFRVTLDVPGLIVTTTGTIEGDGRVEWNFRAADAFPLGFPMHCRSLEVTATAAELLGKFPAGQRRKTLLRLARLLGDADELVPVLRQCVKKKSWSALETHRRGLDPKAKPGMVKQLDRLYRLLDLPRTGSGRVGT